MDTVSPFRQILQNVQYVVDEKGEQTAVLLDWQSWQDLQQFLDELTEDERLIELMDEVASDEVLSGQSARTVYQACLSADDV